MKCKLRSRQQRGITLISLVVTIVVLIILAVVSINTVLGENGIIRRAEIAREYQANAEASDNEALDTLDQHLANAMAGEGNGGETPDEPTGTTLEEAKKDEMLTKTENTEIKIGDDTVWIPAGFKVHEDTADTVDEGIVITDGTNEFVWVPVDDASFNEMFKTAEPAVALSGSTGVTSNYYSNLRVRSGDSSYYATTTPGTTSVTVNGSRVSGVMEPDLIDSSDVNTTNQNYKKAGFSSAQAMAQGFVDDYKAMRTSIETYDGFYIGRYELTGTVASPTVKAGTVLTGNWYDIYKECRNVVTGNEHATTTMIWGCQWDETMNWLKNTEFKDNPDAVDVDSKDWGNYYDVSVLASDGITEIKASGTKKLLETGITTYTMRNKIYDLAGNYFEWTQEACVSGGRVLRGDMSSSVLPASARKNFPPIESHSDGSSRATLYVK